MSHKLLMFLKRRPDLSVEAFRAYYETAHAKLCETYAAGARRYVRRYVEPLKLPGSDAAEELPFDVITEVWIDDPKAFAQIRAATESGLMPPEVLIDEEKLFDRARSRAAVVEEHESDLDAVRAHNPLPAGGERDGGA